MKKITWFVFICIFFLYRPYQMQIFGMMYAGDDASYMAHATSLVYFQFPSYAKELGYSGVPMHSIGPSLLASPFVFIFSLLDRMAGNDVVIERTLSNIIQSWTAFGFTFASIFYLWMTCLVLYQGLKYYFSKNVAAMTVILTVLAQGTPLYALRRPVFSHVYEIFVQSIFVFLLLRLNHHGYLLKNGRFRFWREAAWAGVLAGLVFLVRLNNVFSSLAWPLVLFSLYSPKISRVKFMQILVVSYCFMLACAGVFLFWPIIFNGICEQHGYLQNDIIKSRLFQFSHPFFYLKRLGHLICGVDWGLIFTAPYVLVGLAELLRINKRDKIYNALTMALVPVVINLYITLSYREQGSYYGYRYLIFSLIPLVVYPLARVFSRLTKGRHHFICFFLLSVAILPILSMISFEGNNSNLTQGVIDLGWGVAGWGNNTYQIEIYKMIIQSPREYLAVLLKGGPLYIIYIMTSAFFGCQQVLPAIVYEKYANFHVMTLVRTIIIYLLPFGLFFIYKKAPNCE